MYQYQYSFLLVHMYQYPRSSIIANNKTAYDISHYTEIVKDFQFCLPVHNWVTYIFCYY